MKKRRVVVNDMIQKKYIYWPVEPVGTNFHAEFKPDLTPKQMLELGVFGGKYLTDCRKEFPKSWYAKAKLCHEFHDPKLNYFGVNASKPVSYWKKKGWINSKTRALVQWYCRYTTGAADDARQIRRGRR
jgi:hypothetical protein